jgi:hypothetical protein
LCKTTASKIIGPIRQELLSGIGERLQFEEIRKQLRAFSGEPIVTRDYEEAAQCSNRRRSHSISGSNTDFLIVPSRWGADGKFLRRMPISKPMLDSYFRDLEQEYCNISSSGQQMDDVLNGFVSFVVSGFQFAGGAMSGIGLMMEAAVGQRTTQALVKEQEQKSDLEAFAGEVIGVA